MVEKTNPVIGGKILCIFRCCNRRPYLFILMWASEKTVLKIEHCMSGGTGLALPLILTGLLHSSQALILSS